MGLVNKLFRSAVSQTETSDYAKLLNQTLAKFREDLLAGIDLGVETQTIESTDDLNAWGSKYNAWQLRTVEGKKLKEQLVMSRPKDRAFLKLHNGLTILMNNRNIEQTQTFNMFLAKMQNDLRGENQYRAKAEKADREGDEALEYCRKQIATLQREKPQLLDSLHLPDWVIEM